MTGDSIRPVALAWSFACVCVDFEGFVVHWWNEIRCFGLTKINVTTEMRFREKNELEMKLKPPTEVQF